MSNIENTHAYHEALQVERILNNIRGYHFTPRQVKKIKWFLDCATIVSPLTEEYLIAEREINNIKD